MREHLKPHDRRLVVGITGSGKSHYTKSLVRSTPRVVVWDLCAEYARACDLDEVSTSEFEREPELITRAECRLAIVPEWDEPADLRDGLKALSRIYRAAAEEATEGDECRLPTTLLVIEEIVVHRPQADGVLTMFAVLARHWNAPLVMVAQRAMGIPPAARAQANSIVSFRQTETDDLEALREKFKDRTDKIATLQRGKALIWQQADAWSHGGKNGEE